MGHATYWFDKNDDVKGFDFSHTLFITEGQADDNIPLRSDCYYVLHNCTSNKYHNILKSGKAIILQVYTDDCLQRPNLKKIAPCIYCDVSQQIIHMPWATDLLPHEIEQVQKQVKRTFSKKDRKQKYLCWIGTYAKKGLYQNYTEIIPFLKIAKKERIRFVQKGKVSIQKNTSLVLHAYMAPTIVGSWQKEHGYIPCRIFKNISYGQWGITNSYRVWELFEKKIVYNANTSTLFYDAKKRLQTLQLHELLELMDFVKTKHTYINRIETLLDFLNQRHDYVTNTFH